LRERRTLKSTGRLQPAHLRTVPPQGIGIARLLGLPTHARAQPARERHCRRRSGWPEKPGRPEPGWPRWLCSPQEAGFRSRRCRASARRARGLDSPAASVKHAIAAAVRPHLPSTKDAESAASSARSKNGVSKLCFAPSQNLGAKRRKLKKRASDCPHQGAGKHT
jgi:hypothetical protein